MVIASLKILFKRDLTALIKELNTYQNENVIWATDKQIANSAGNLCLHLIGNLNTYIGAEIGKTGYIRDRALEFSAKNISKSELIQKIDETIIVVHQALDQLSEEDLETEYPLLVLDKKTSYVFFLVHLASHLAYHLGQITYHRRLLDV
ncbi:DinB family protein [Flavobacterium sp. TSSA_36]|uniref:DinB family protein n=1 Tax=Flavobacterium sp. TSSA_36 TaxID=3447669 RepID=UPI003F2FE527